MQEGEVAPLMGWWRQRPEECRREAGEYTGNSIPGTGTASAKALSQSLLGVFDEQ